MDEIFVLLIYDLTRWRLRFHGTDFLASISMFSILSSGFITHTMRAVLHNLGRIFEAPLTHVEPICFATSHEIFGIERRIPRLDVQISQHHIGDIRRGHWFAGRTVR